MSLPTDMPTGLLVYLPIAVLRFARFALTVQLENAFEK